MKIALLTSKYPRINGTFIQREINGLKKSGASLSIFPLYDVDKSLFSNKNVLSTFENEAVKWPKIIYCNSFSINYLKGFVKLLINLITEKEIWRMMKAYYNAGLLDLLKFIYILPKAFFWENKVKEFDHILSFWGNYSASASYILSKNIKIPFSTYLHAGTDLYRKQTYLNHKLIEARKIICVCDFNRRFLKKLYPQYYTNIKNKIIIHHLGLDLKRMQSKPLKIDDKLFKICCIGSLEEYKGPMYVLRAFKIFLDNGNKGNLYFCGVGNLENSLKSFAKKNIIGKFVFFKGNCSNDEVNKIISDSHVLVHGSPYIGDAVPTVIKEAMSLSRAVIGTNIAGIPELINNEISGYIVPPKNSEEIANKFQILNNDRQTCFKMGVDGNKIAKEKFNLWKNTGFLLNELKKEL